MRLPRRWQLWAAVGLNVLVVSGVILFLVAVNRGHQRLMDAPALERPWLGHVGPAEATLDFQRLLRDPRGVALFGELLRDGTAAGRVYGLCGLYHRDRAGFEQARRDMAIDFQSLQLLGCLPQVMKVSELADMASLEPSCDSLRLPLWQWALAEVSQLH